MRKFSGYYGEYSVTTPRGRAHATAGFGTGDGLGPEPGSGVVHVSGYVRTYAHGCMDQGCTAVRTSRDPRSWSSWNRYRWVGSLCGRWLSEDFPPPETGEFYPYRVGFNHNLQVGRCRLWMLNDDGRHIHIDFRDLNREMQTLDADSNYPDYERF